MSDSPEVTVELGDADRARLAQQSGINPAPHVFQPLQSDPHMCGFDGCYATREAKKPWHLDVFFESSPES